MHELKPQVDELEQRRGVSSGVTPRPHEAFRGIRSLGLGLFLMLALIGAPAACSGDSNNAGAGGSSGGSGGAGGTGGTGGADGGGDDDGSTSCDVATGVDTYVANLTKKGKNDVLSFQLVQSDPAPPAEGTNVWKVKVLGGDGMPIANDKLTVEIFMPSHKHNTPIPPFVFYDNATKIFTINPTHFSMGGTWRITLTVYDPMDPSLPIDSVAFFFCVD